MQIPHPQLEILEELAVSEPATITAPSKVTAATTGHEAPIAFDDSKTPGRRSYREVVGGLIAALLLAVGLIAYLSKSDSRPPVIQPAAIPATFEAKAPPPQLQPDPTPVNTVPAEVLQQEARRRQYVERLKNDYEAAGNGVSIAIESLNQGRNRGFKGQQLIPYYKELFAQINRQIMIGSVLAEYIEPEFRAGILALVDHDRSFLVDVKARYLQEVVEIK